MKPYLIYLDLLPLIDCEDRPTKEIAEIARAQALKTAKKQFKSLLETQITAKEIVLPSSQPEDAVAIAISEKVLDKILQQLINMEIVSTIDAQYSGKSNSEEPPKKDMKRFLK